jgi:hypothetical protein
MDKIVKLIKESLNQSNKKQTTLKFDSSTSSPFIVIFSERGFSIEDTRMSFELIEEAIKKNFHITLNSGNGMILDHVKMQKILKYKNLYNNGTEEKAI